MAAITSKAVTGNLSTNTNWVGDVAPVNGDIITVVNGAKITDDINISLGSKASGVGNAFTVQGASSSNYGELIIPDGVTLTVAGYDINANKLGNVARYGKLTIQPGATILGDVTTACSSYLKVDGILSAVGTAEKPINFSVPTGQYNWNNSGSYSLLTTHEKAYWPDKNIISIWLVKGRISNSSGTAKGVDTAAGSSSISITASAPSGIFTTRKTYQLDSDGLPDPSNLTSFGDYAINHDNGHILVNRTGYADTDVSATITYKYLTFIGWSLVANANTTYNSAVFDHCNFRYMGADSLISFNLYGLTIAYKQSAALDATRLFYLKNSTILNCACFLDLKSVTGTAADPILITGDTFRESSASASSIALITWNASNNSYIKFDSNKVYSLSFWMNGYGSYGTPISISNLKFTNNIIFSSNGWVNVSDYAIVYPDADISNNIFRGIGATSNSSNTTFIKLIAGTSGHPVLIQDNEFGWCYRTIMHLGYVHIERNKFVNCFKHSNMMGGSGGTFQYVPDTTFINNIAWGNGTPITYSGQFQLGYNNKCWVDGCLVKNNTFNHAINGIDVADADAGSSSGSLNITLIGTGLEVDNNIVANKSEYGITIKLGRDSIYNRSRLSIVSMDNNDVFNSGTAAYNNVSPGTFFMGGQRYNTNGSRNCLGLNLNCPSQTSFTGKTLTYTYTSATDFTVTWDGGTPVQLVKESGTATSASNHTNTSTGVPDYGILNDTSKNWPIENYTNVANPAALWIKITGGPGAGQVRMIGQNLATALYVIPSWITVPGATSTYSIIRPDVAALDSGGVQSVRIGVDPRYLPTSTVSDTDISLTVSSITSDPVMTRPISLSLDVNDFKIQPGAGNSPAVGAGTSLNAPTTDYFGSTRPYNGTYDIGAHEYIDTGATLMIGL